MSVTTGIVVVAVASGLFAYGMVRSLDGHLWARVHAWWRGAALDEIEAAAYLEGCKNGYQSGRESAIREAHARERDLGARAYAQGFNAASQTWKVGPQ